ncbi:DUF4156 domain-containing protein [Acinetobacter baumannii]|uniref:DUF4156 domain-containing protein n=1 Tax=Acinetobacter baumannii TaxID=470 RepID=UPI0018980658|nr:DUF4156 domain-containing protein [Acinetobacter baumannii]EKV1658172.1 DUF4156 domain-containing protein [Acinetobacter baumannii]EKV1847083.1 DUF4156 domain-containing protein [Acinetobacter baumannii]EKV4645626.1 DUF4156 domain-containing protein [Acinetobacter baumannii]MBF6833633.1 DUF4156 domain-containing protein [Acinetobacter baumannii]MDC4480843.1 DUF4156 domain-containing protein [Acinetobacter baumannii]
MKNLLIIGLATFILSGCVIQRGTHIRTGEFRQPTTADSVRLYYSEPSDYKILGMVTGEGSHAFVSDQTRLNAAISRMKKEAAALGANGVLLQNVGKVGANHAVYQQVGNIGITTQAHDSIVNGVAIYVEN